MADQSTSTTTTTGSGQQADDTTTRIASIEREQREQRGILEQLLGRLTPGGKTTSTGTETQAGGGTAGLDIGAIQDQVRREITAADERREADKRERDWREQVTEVVEAVKKEKQPREQQTGVRSVLRRALIGRDA
jgi:hypothetical protein